MTSVLIDSYMPAVKFSSLILAEPMILSPSQAGHLAFDMSAGAARRQHIWGSRAEALEHIRTNRRLRTWDPDVQLSYVVRDFMLFDIGVTCTLRQSMPV